MITAEIKMGEHACTRVDGDTIEEVLEKIQSYHTMSSFITAHYTKKGTLEHEMKTGWWMASANPEQTKEVANV